MKLVNETIHSDVGFYIGDVMLALPEEIYYGIWGGNYWLRDEPYINRAWIDDPSGLKFVVAETAKSKDGPFKGDNGTVFKSEFGSLGIVPLEILSDTQTTESGFIIHMAGEATLTVENGIFKIVLPDKSVLTIDTNTIVDLKE